MVKFSRTVKQIPGTQARLPENTTDQGQKPLCLRGNKTLYVYVEISSKGRGCKIRFSSCLSHEAASPSAYSCLPHSHCLFSLLPSQRAAAPWGTHLWSRAGREGRWHILPQPTPFSGTGPRRTDEPGILSAWFCRLTDGLGLGTGERR